MHTWKGSTEGLQGGRQECSSQIPLPLVTAALRPLPPMAARWPSATSTAAAMPAAPSGDTSGTVAVDGGSMANSTTLGITANGGTAIADASGGSYNLAFVS